MAAYDRAAYDPRDILAAYDRAAYDAFLVGEGVSAAAERRGG
jgi:hypothetical protein